MNRFAFFLILLRAPLPILCSYAQIPILYANAESKPDSGLHPISRTDAGAAMQDTTNPSDRPVQNNRPGQNDRDQTFSKVTRESYFPGGTPGWAKFLNTHLVYPPKALRQKIEGTVILQFIIDKDGSLTGMKVLSGDPILAEASMKMMQESPNWIPAVQNGWPVKSIKKQPIVFSLAGK